MATGKSAALTVVLVFVQAMLAFAPAVCGAGPGASEECGGSVESRAAPRLPSGFLDGITPDAVSGDIAALQSFGTRYTYSDKADEAALYIMGRFSSMGLTAYRQSFFYNGFTMSNVVAVLPGRNASLPWVVLGAHYDSVNGSGSYQNPYAPAPGADDDASGVAAVLAAAGAFARAPVNASILFVAFAAEEQGRIGSAEFVRQLRDNDTHLAGALCYDMIGYNHRYAKVDLVSNAGSSWLAERAQHLAYGQGILTELVVTNSTPYRWSDQVSFWERGYPAMYFIEDENPTESSLHFEANPYYHSGEDTLDKLNASLVAKVARLGAATAAELAGLALPDFRPVLKNVTDPALAEEPVVFRVALENTGQAVPLANVSLFVDGTLWENRTLVPDGEQFVYISWTGPVGPHIVSIVANTDGRYAEWDLADNGIELAIDIRPRPDVHISKLEASDPAPLPGRPMQLVALVGNSGGVAATCTFRIETEDAMVFEEQLAIAPGDNATVVAPVAGPQLGTNYTARLFDVLPWEVNAGDNVASIEVIPHLLDAGSLRLAAEPEATMAGALVRLGVEGALQGEYEYLFDFGDGFGAGWTLDPWVPYMYRSAGTFEVSVRVRDARGAESFLPPLPLLVVNQHPVPVIETSSTDIRMGMPVLLSGARSYDPDGSIYGYSWDFGDGGMAVSPEVHHTFSALRTHIVRLTVTDNAGYANVSTLSITPRAATPAARFSISWRVLQTGENATFNASGSASPDGNLTSYEWSFGDGGGAQGLAVEHRYSASGRYNVTLTVQDSFGANDTAASFVLVFDRRTVPPDGGNGGGSGGMDTGTAALLLLLVSVLLVTGAVMLRSGGRGKGWNRSGAEEEE